MKRVSFLVLLFVVFLAATGFSAQSRANLKIFYDTGAKKTVQNFQDAAACQATPCIVNKYAAIRLPKGFKNRYEVGLSYIHNDQLESLALFQAGSTLDERLAERIFNKKQNRQIFNLENAILAGQTDTIYLYGIRLHYEFDEGDVMVLMVTDRKNTARKYEYYFRYHVPGPIWDIDVALLFPIRYFKPNPAQVIRGGRVALGLSYSLGWYMDPEKKYPFLRKFLHAWKFNMVGGILTRQEVVTYTAGDRIVDTKFDGFVGGGFTFLDIVTAGYAVNLVRSPHSAFPFVGIETKHLYDLIKSVKKNSGKKWQRYLEKQYRQKT